MQAIFALMLFLSGFLIGRYPSRKAARAAIIAQIGCIALAVLIAGIAMPDWPLGTFFLPMLTAMFIGMITRIAVQQGQTGS